MFRKQLGRAMGAGEPLKHEEPVRGVRQRPLLFQRRNPGSPGWQTWQTSCFPSQRAEGNHRSLPMARLCTAGC